MQRLARPASETEDGGDHPPALNITQHADTDSPCSVLDLGLLSAAIGTSVTEPD